MRSTTLNPRDKYLNLCLSQAGRHYGTFFISAGYKPIESQKRKFCDSNNKLQIRNQYWNKAKSLMPNASAEFASLPNFNSKCRVMNLAFGTTGMEGLSGAVVPYIDSVA